MQNLRLQRFLGLIPGCVLAISLFFICVCAIVGTIPGAMAEADDSPGDQLLDDYLDNSYSDKDSDKDSGGLLEDDDKRRRRIEREEKHDERERAARERRDDRADNDDDRDDDDEDEEDRLRSKWLEDFQDTDFRKKTFDDFLLRDPRRDSRARDWKDDRDDDDGDDRDPVTKSDRDERKAREDRERRDELRDMRPDSSELADEATLPGDDDDDADDGRVTEQPDLGGDYEDDPAVKRDDERVFRSLTKPIPGMLKDWVPDRVNRLHNGAFEKEPDNGFPVPYRLNGHLDIQRKRPWAEEAD